MALQTRAQARKGRSPPPPSDDEPEADAEQAEEDKYSVDLTPTAVERIWGLMPDNIKATAVQYALNEVDWS